MTSPTPSTPILLLKTKSSPADSYEEYFSAHNYTPTFIPVLEHHFHTQNLSTVKQLFQSGSLTPGPGRKYGGLIFTSQRAVEGFATILRDIDVLYTVGPATSRSLVSIRDEHLPHATVLGEETGSGENLAHFILSHYNGLYETEGGKPPLLFLVGEQRRDVIPKTLMAGSLAPGRRIGVEELVVYETGVMEGFEESFAAAVRAGEGFLAGGLERAVWVVVFSPTGCDAMLRVLKGLADGERRVFIATIGPTTRDHLRKYGFEADVCAEKPSQEGVGMGIERFMEHWRRNRTEQ
ncbi:tetrapyrrole biosynthesis, uroporphyrinogen III synthase [Aspergillus coremiiformis]|uniref:Tetrapyrrole biosynthesis, uroporphyrinogen III synthase n=1 Tax=Aspergillus coremiiformis TaxID=138285 RepID=A0A5N6ZD36_9EURO|nr:tetrapyrrole biosynthesis, uroporphyrinogen III synthase [Aspergillus coremiiformis]